MSSVEKAIHILKLIRKHGPQMGVTELAKLLSVDKASVHRILTALKNEHLVLQDTATKKYTLGPTILWLAEGLRNDPLILELTKIMINIRDYTGETVILYQLLGLSRVVVATVESNNTIRRVVPAGTVYSVHTGTTGKVMLASMPVEECEAILSRLVEEGALNRAGLDDVKRKIEEARLNRYYMGLGDRDKDFGAISFPLSGNYGLYGGVAVSGPVARWNLETIQPYIEGIRVEVNKMCKKVSERF